jgi:outer membrane protein TolC
MQQVLAGAPASELTVEFERREALVINMATARAIGVSPSFRVLTEAELLHEERTDIQRRLSLSGVVKEAEQVNLDLAAADREVAAGRAFVNQLRSPLLPQVGITGGGNFIDRDRASLGAGQNPQHLAFGTLAASQVIYSEELKGAWDAGKTNQRALEQSRNSTRLDVIEDAATSYLGVLRAKTIERIQKDNLDLTRSNLRLAQVRVEIGQAGRDEVYRWESQLSNNQRSVIDANAVRNVAEIQVNQVLNRPIEEPFVTTEVGLDDPELATSFEKLRPYVDSPASFDIYRNFMTAEAFAQSPEVRELEYLVQSNQRIVKLSRRAYYIPGIQASASGTYLGRYGEGSAAPPPPLDSFFTNPYNWQLSITGTYDIFNGGFRESRLSQAREDLRQFETRLAAVRQRVEQRVRSELHLAGASFVGIDLSLDSARAARQNLELVQASYAEGVVDILRLLDAQNWALSADLASANAIFNHLSDLMRVQRAVGKFDYYRSPEDRQEFLNRLDEFFKNAGYEVRK